MKKKILILVLHRPGRSPSQRFRFEQYLGYLKQEGFEYHFSYLLNEKDDKIFYSKGNFIGKALILAKSTFKRLGELLIANSYDFIFIQRECYMLGTSIFEKLFSLSKAKLIFDFDDSIWLQNVSDANKKFVWLKNPQKTAQIIKVSDIIIAGNDYLADYARKINTNVEVIPTTIDIDEYVPVQKKPGDKICIGWSGSITTIQHFKYALPVLEAIKKKYGDRIIFKVIGDASYTNENLGIKGIPWTKENEIKEIATFDIGIMPLPDDEWTRGKCGLKGLSYMAMEVATIMSPVGVNKQIIKDGENGFLALSNEDWINKLSQLIDSLELRIEFGKKGRQTVVDYYSSQANKTKFVSIFNSF